MGYEELDGGGGGKNVIGAGEVFNPRYGLGPSTALDPVQQACGNGEFSSTSALIVPTSISRGKSPDLEYHSLESISLGFGCEM